jgi:hypothetical protein
MARDQGTQSDRLAGDVFTEQRVPELGMRDLVW